MKEFFPQWPEHLPHKSDSFEVVRQFWLNEAMHNSDEYAGVLVASGHLDPMAQSCVNVMTLCSSVREAIVSGKSEMISALSMLLISELIGGGVWRKMEKAYLAQNKRFEKGAGDQIKITGQIKIAILKKANEIWKEKSDTRIGDVVDELYGFIQDRKAGIEELRYVPTKGTIRTWLKNASKAGALQIPAQAQRAGRRAAA